MTGVVGGGVAELVVGQLRRGWRPWLGSLAVSVAAGACVLLGVATASVSSSGGRGDPLRFYSALGGSVAMFVCLAGVVAVSQAAAVAVQLQRRDVAAWMLAGLRPRLAGRVVGLEVCAVAVAGAVAGCVLGRLLWSPWCGLLERSGAPPVPGGLPFPWAGGLGWTLAVMLAAGWVGARRAVKQARRVGPLEVMQGTGRPGRRRRTGRAVWAGLFGLGLAGCLAGVAVFKPAGADSDPALFQQVVVLYLATATLLTGLVACLGPGFLAGLVRLWTGLVPARASLSWHLARNRARTDVEFSSALVTPLVVAMALVGALYGWVDQARDAAAAMGQAYTGDGMPVFQVVSMVGGPVLIAAVSVAGMSFALGLRKTRETVLLRVAGASRRVLAAKAACEAVIYTATAVIVTVLILAVNNAAFAFALRLGPVRDATMVGLPAAPFWIAAAALPVLAAAAVPTLRRALAANPAETLATE